MFKVTELLSVPGDVVIRETVDQRASGIGWSTSSLSLDNRSAETSTEASSPLSRSATSQRTAP
jgi:hypothetical protein